MAAGQGGGTTAGGGGEGPGGPAPGPGPGLVPPSAASSTSSSSSTEPSSGFFGLGLPAHLTLSYPGTGPAWGAAGASPPLSSAAASSSGGAASSSPHTGRSLDKALEEASSSGILCLSGRKLRDFPAATGSATGGYDLSDTTQAGAVM
uniref:Uncharacterized protein n=1 Tax=Sphaerodactylus townsendi TaxID=933632 RepID=A0ACB8FXD8_9SAUR